MDQQYSDQASRFGTDPASIQHMCQQSVRDESKLRDALRVTDTMPQLLVHAHLSGDRDLLHRAARYVEGGWSYQHHFPDDFATEVQDRLVQTLLACAAAPPGVSDLRPDVEAFVELLSAGIGEALPERYAEMMLEELSLTDSDPRTVDWSGRLPASTLENYHVAIVGAGLSGICLGAKLREMGLPFKIYEKNDEVGGTWYENRYPGCGVDIPNHFYCFSFEPNPEWKHHFAKRDELLDYLRHCADKYGVREHIRFRTEVTDARFDETEQHWVIGLRDADGHTSEHQSRILVSAVGQLNKPLVPDFPGMDRFLGPIFHTAQWRHDVDLAGKRVALIGTGASAMQVAPAIATEVEKLTILQRSPNWAAPNPNYHKSVPAGMRWALHHVPFLERWYRFLLFWASGDILHSTLQRDPDWPHPERSINARNEEMRRNLVAHIEKELGDRTDLLDKVIPDYPPYGKRMLRDNHWYRTLTRDNVELVARGVTAFEPDAVIDAEGERHTADVVILSTGFQATRMLWPMAIAGRGGQTIRDAWGDDDPRAYLGMTVPGFPNFFIMYGPNTNLAHGGSLFFHAECQTRYISQALRELVEDGGSSLEVRPEPYNEYCRRVDVAHDRMVWTHPGMSNWYRNSKGRVVTNSPWRLVDYWALTRKFDASEYHWTPARERSISHCVPSAGVDQGHH